MTFLVTQKDIDGAKRRSICECPIARSVRRRLNLNAGDIELSTDECIVNGEVFFDVPRRMEDWIGQFDAGKPMTPARFLVELF